MAGFKLEWDQIGEKKFETGVDHAVLYPINHGAYPKGVVWNGVTSISESPDGGDAQDFYADNIKYGSLRGAENFNGTIECYTYPDEWKECDGRKTAASHLAVGGAGVSFGQQYRKAFGLSYRTLIGNDTDLLDHGYTIHLVYNATASPSDKQRQTVNESPEAQTFSYEFKTTPVNVTALGAEIKPTAHIELDSTKLTPAQMNAVLKVLYGTAGTITYRELADTADRRPKQEGLYERTGEAGAYTYFLSDDPMVDETKKYYEKVETGAVEGRLPLPDELLHILDEAAA